MADAFALTYGAETLNLSDWDNYILLKETLDLREPGIVKFTLLLVGTDSQDRADKHHDLITFLNHGTVAEGIGKTATFTWSRGTDHTQICDFYEGTAPLSPAILGNGRYQECYVELKAYPYFRSASYTTTISGNLVGSTAAYLVEGVPGNAPALVHGELVDTSLSGIINEVIMGVYWEKDLGASPTGTEFVAWHDLTAAGSGTSGAEADAMGDAVNSNIAFTNTTMTDFGTVSLPTSGRYRGVFDGWLRLQGDGELITVPTGLGSTITEPTITITEVETTPETITADETPAIPDSTSGGATTGTSFNVTGLSRTAGDLVMVFVYSRDATPPAVSSITSTGLAMTLVAARTGDTTTHRYEIWVDENVDSTSSTQLTVTMDATISDTRVLAIAANGLAASGMLERIREYVAAKPGISAIGTTNLPNQLALFFQGASISTSLAGTFDNGYTLLQSANGTVAGYKVIEDIGTTPTSEAFGVLDATWSGFQLLLSPDTTTVPAVTDTSTEYAQPTPGVLEPGTYSCRVQARDLTGKRSNATSSNNAVVTVQNSSVAWDWADTTGAASYAVSISAAITGQPTRVYETIVSTSTFTLTDLSLLGEINALPLTSGATATPMRARAVIGTTNDYVFTPGSDDEILVPNATSGYYLKKAFTAVPLPPSGGAMLDGSWIDSTIKAQGASGNGIAGGQLRFDAVFLLPSNRPQARLWAEGHALASASRFVFETHRSGTGMVVWLENTAGSAEAGRLHKAGTMRLLPGDNILLFAFLQAAEKHSFDNARMTCILTIYPRTKWERAT